MGLSVDNLEVESALTSDRLSEEHLAAGLYDDARVEILRVNWQAPEQRVLMRSGSLGEVSRAGASFRAEVRGLAHYLQQPKGRLFQYTCDADLGDGRCGVNVAAGGYRGSGTIATVISDRSFTAAGLDSFADGWFARGLVTFASGANAGRAIAVKRHTQRGGVVTVELWQEPAQLPLPGDTFTVSAGCDKHLATCRAKFSNTVNFRGFPHMPGNDFVTSYVRRDG